MKLFANLYHCIIILSCDRKVGKNGGAGGGGEAVAHARRRWNPSRLRLTPARKVAAAPLPHALSTPPPTRLSHHLVAPDLAIDDPSTSGLAMNGPGTSMAGFVRRQAAPPRMGMLVLDMTIFYLSF